MKKSIFFIWIISLVILGSACSEFRAVQKSEDWKVKYKAGLDYYEAGDYYKAIVLFEDILPIVKGVKEGEEVYFYYAYAHYNFRNQYVLSAYHFKKFYETYSRSKYAEEANYLYAHSLYLDSPRHNLDQTSSYEAIDAMQSFITRYPKSEYLSEADKIIGDLQVKLEKKAYLNAREYYKLSRYKAAVIAFDNFASDYPDSDFQEEIAYLKVDAQYNLARLSIPLKQRERYLSAIEFYQAFLDKYQNSQYLKSAESLFDKSQNQLRKLGGTATTLSSSKK